MNFYRNFDHQKSLLDIIERHANAQSILLSLIQEQQTVTTQ